jgi:CMP/dCMP kinase
MSAANDTNTTKHPSGSSGQPVTGDGHAASGTLGGDVVVTIDGPAGAGKSTVARAVAARTGLRYLNTGAIYRAVTLELLRRGVALDDPAAIAKAAAAADVELRPDPNNPRVLTVWLGGDEPGAALRTGPVTAAVSTVSAVPAVRERLVAIQRAAIGGGGVVVEGRDIGTVVWPQAEVKVFLTADPLERARRRGADEGEVAGTALADRDRKDSGRAVAPTRAHPDATVIDSTGMPLEEVVTTVIVLIEDARQWRART